MRAFAALYDALDTTTSTSAKVAALAAHLREAPAADAAWAVHLLAGGRLSRVAAPSELRDWLYRHAPWPAWLVEETAAAVGDTAETIALLMSAQPSSPDGGDDEAAGDVSLGLAAWVEQRLLPLRDCTRETREATVTRWWRSLDAERCFLVNKLMTGGLRVGVSRALVARAVAEVSGLDRAVVQHRMMGRWTPGAAAWRALVAPGDADADRSRPYPFFLASPLAADELPAERLGDRRDWLAEWKWDGIRAQLVRRDGQTWLWTRGEELVTDRYPEIADAAATLPDGTVLDGELLAWDAGGVMPFASLQRRIGRRRVSARLLDEVPVRLLAYDLLERHGTDLRGEPLTVRRQALETLLDGAPAAFGVSPLLAAPDWPALSIERDGARARRVEGLMLKRVDSPYRVGRVRGDWWKWKLAPLTLDVVMLYAQPGRGRRANLYTDYTFGVRDGTALVPIAKAYSGLSNDEITRLDRWIRAHTTERFGPVRAVDAVQVFELAFEGIARSARHKSGLALRFPRIVRWREDLAADDTDTLADARALLAGADDG